MVPRRTPLPCRLSSLVLTLVGAFALGLLPSPVRAAAATVWSPYTSVYSATTAGKVILRGNSVVTCDPDSPTCVAARENQGRTLDNDGLVDRFVDVDQDPATYDSSAALVPVPATARVLFAGLYWSGDGRDIQRPADPDRRSVVSVKAPGATRYRTVTSTRTASGTAGSSRPYQGYADVTGLVAAAGAGTYTVGNLATTLPGGWGGWALVVAYADASEPVRAIDVVNGFGTVAGGSSLAAVADGFVAPAKGPVAADVGAVIWDGDAGQSGEELSVGGVVVGDGANPVDNVGNSSVTSDGKAVSGRTPAQANTFGTDVDRIRVPAAAVPPGSTSTRIRLTSTGDTVHAGPFVLQTPVQAPDMHGTLTASPAAPRPGQQVTYTYAVDNRGADTAAAARLVVPVPLHTTYVAGSLRVDGVRRTDKADTDAGAYAAGAGSRGQVAVGLGSGARSATGGVLAVRAVTTVAFSVVVDRDLGPRTEVVALGRLSGRSRANGQRITALTTSTRAVVTNGTGTLPVLAADAATGRAEYAGSVDLDPLANDPVTSSPPPALILGEVTAGSDGETFVFDATVRYQYSEFFAGLDFFTYAVDAADGSSATGVAVVTVTNATPTARADPASTTAGEAVDIYPLGNDTDPNSDVLVIAGVSGVDPKKGRVTVLESPGVGADTLHFVPARGFRGTVVFGYRITDARGASAGSTVTVRVT